MYTMYRDKYQRTSLSMPWMKPMMSLVLCTAIHKLFITTKSRNYNFIIIKLHIHFRTIKNQATYCTWLFYWSVSYSVHGKANLNAFTTPLIVPFTSHKEEGFLCTGEGDTQYLGCQKQPVTNRKKSTILEAEKWAKGNEKFDFRVCC